MLNPSTAAGEPQDTKGFIGTWLSGGVTLSFGPNPAEVSETVKLTLQDDVQRTLDVSTPVTWAVANGIADLGYDEAGSQGNSKWLYFYAVPKSGDDSLLTIRASDNVPSTGPAGYTEYKCVCSAYMEAGATLRQFLQTGNKFTYAGFITDYNQSNVAAFAWTSRDVSVFVPQTAQVAHTFMRIVTSVGTNGYQHHVSGVSGSGFNFVESYSTGEVSYDTGSADIPIFTAQTLYHTLILVLGSGTCLGVSWFHTGYTDGAIDS